MILFRLALRNLWRNRRRTLLTLAAMVASLSLLILALGVFSGMFADMLATATEQYSGHIVISRAGYQDQRDLYLTFPQDELPPARLLAHPGVRGASPRLRGFGLSAFGDHTRPMELLGVLPARERQVTRLAEVLTAGRFLAPDDTEGVVIGRGLAERLRVKVGQRILFVTQAADGSIGNDLMTVRGIFATGDSATDNGLGLVPLSWLQQLLVLPGRLHEIALTVDKPLAAASLAAELQRQLPDDLRALDWGRLLPEMAEVVASYDASTLILSLILYAAAGLGIVNTLYMSVLERTREFGLLLAMGLKPGQIRLLVLLESGLLGVISVVVGSLLGLAMSLWMKWVGIDLSGVLSPVTYAGGTILPRLHAELDPYNFWLPALLLLLISLAAGWLPARRAARLLPVAALRGD